MASRHAGGWTARAVPVVAMAAVFALSGCGLVQLARPGQPTPSAIPPSPASSTTATGSGAHVPGVPGPIGGSTPSSGASSNGPTSAPAEPDRASVDQALRSAPVPSLCEHPAGTLRNGALPGIPSGQGEVTVNTGTASGDRVPPVLLESGRAVVAVAKCSQGGVAWPESVLAWTWDGHRLALRGAVVLSSVNAVEHSTLTRLAASGSRASVSWVSTEGCCSDRKTWTAMIDLDSRPIAIRSVTQRSGRHGREISVPKQTQTGFVTPSGNITCVISGKPQDIRCDIADKSWSVRAPKSCSLSYGRAFGLSDHARMLCVGDSVQGSAQSGTDATWWRLPGYDPVVATGGGTSVALGYGSEIAFGNSICSSRSSGLTCKNFITGAGFTLSQAKYSLTR